MVDILRELWARSVAWFKGRHVDDELSQELLEHVELATADELERGHSLAEARRRALARLGGLAAATELHRQSRGLPLVDALGRDAHHALRLLRRSPGFTGAAVLSLALGIGANSALFSIVNALLLRPLPVQDPSTLIQLLSAPDTANWSHPQWEQIRSRRDLFAGVAAWGSPSLVQMAALDEDELHPLAAYTVSGDFFGVLGIRPARGRLLSPRDVTGAASDGIVAVISHSYWTRRFGKADDIIGRTIGLDRFVVTIVGVTPPEFFGPEVGRSFDIILPISALPRQLLDLRGFSWLSIVARLRPGQTATDAASALRVIQSDMRDATMPGGLLPEQLDAYLREPIDVRSMATGTSTLRTRYVTPLLVVLGMAGLVLLVACANIANLLLARGMARRHEFGLRLALGASRSQLIRQLVIESVLLAGVGAVAGLAIAAWASRMLVSQLAASVALPLPFDWRVLVFTAVTALVAVLLFGVGPALQATRVAPRLVLADRSRTIAGWSGRPAAHALIVAQVALSLILTVAGILFVSTFTTLASADLGFDPDHVHTVRLTRRPGATARSEAESTDRLLHVLAAVRATPGVRQAAFVGATIPMGGVRQENRLDNPAGLTLPDAARQVSFHDVGRSWFDVMDMHIVGGRDFDASDTPVFQNVAIVNQALARRFFPDRSPIGQTIREENTTAGSAPARVIVGVVNDAIYDTARAGAPPTVYRFIPRSSRLVVRVAPGASATVTSAIARAVATADPTSLTTAERLYDQANATVARERMLAAVSGFFGVLAVLLAGIGIYGVTAHAVGQRQKEFAVRRALGATPVGILWLVLARGLGLVGSGVAMGSLASLWMIRLLHPLLYGQDARTHIIVLASGAVLGVVGVAAALLPAARAVRVQPAAALR